MTAEGFQLATPDPAKLLRFQPCMDDYGVHDPADPWANNCVANDAVAYSNGLIARTGEATDLRYLADELALCSRLSTEAGRVMGWEWPGMYSANTPLTAPYFVVSATLHPMPTPSADLVRAVFGGALCDHARIAIEPLDEVGEWWAQVRQCGAECEEDDLDFDAEAEVIAP